MSGGGKGGSSRDKEADRLYREQLREQQAETAKAKAEAERLKGLTAEQRAARRERAQAAYLTSGGGLGDTEIVQRKSLLGSGT